MEDCVLARKLFDPGFDRSKIVQYISKPNQGGILFEYLRLFDFSGLNVLDAFRNFVSHFELKGETQEQDRIVKAFAARYVDSNPSVGFTVDSAHKLVYAFILLNTDLHSIEFEHRMTKVQFIQNLNTSDPNEFDNHLLDEYYDSIKARPILQPKEKTSSKTQSDKIPFRGFSRRQIPVGGSAQPASIEAPSPSKAGILIRKQVFDDMTCKSSNRQWKKFYVKIIGSDLIFFKSKEVSFDVAKARGHIPLRQAFASQLMAEYSSERRFVFQIITYHGGLFLLQSSSAQEVDDWVTIINWWASRESRVPLPQAIGNTFYGFEKHWCMEFVTALEDAQQTSHLELTNISELNASNPVDNLTKKESLSENVFLNLERLQDSSISIWSPPYLPFVPASLCDKIEEVTLRGKASMVDKPLGHNIHGFFDPKRQLLMWRERYGDLINEMRTHLESREILKCLGIGGGIQESLNSSAYLLETDKRIGISQLNAGEKNINDYPDKVESWNNKHAAITAGNSFRIHEEALGIEMTGKKEGSVLVTLPPPSNLSLHISTLPRSLISAISRPRSTEENTYRLPDFSKSNKKLAQRIDQNWRTKFSFLQWEICKVRHYIGALRKEME